MTIISNFFILKNFILTIFAENITTLVNPGLVQDTSSLISSGESDFGIEGAGMFSADASPTGANRFPSDLDCFYSREWRSWVCRKRRH
ncbi:hypothetical protein PPL_10143 [Heterostelium album PN500]|uniref:Uncharacterized protein n=1 Tax=Heterostelium pallidum (strain ATCC 26659 / Pp 5 / PN500) TaxID=670386 RepID=D3BQF8_HETP5|nr:hypothetical protein PPL_10143 [Heterostelium album PN500]EFA76378.1 hypothetical protein PPL_10143 [Heterostelium album PN500]|eukprot:XP_020428510.1 hypothetical protein PPL_10143 [Heterostelium album PN500]